MDRYVKPMETKITDTGRLVYRPNLPSYPIYNPYTDSIIVASDGMRMDVLANNAYGSAGFWWKIAAINNSVNGSLYLKPGMQVIIPK